MTTKRTVTVLLSTYNGEKYLKEQLESILNQEDVCVYVLIRDDGSTDATLSLLKKYEERHHNIHLIAGDNIGYTKSFSFLIHYASMHCHETTYYAFSDQDDIWLPQKLKNACEKLDEYDNQQPNLFCCNSMMVNNKFEELGLFLSRNPEFTLQNSIRKSLIQGCSMVFNKKAIDLYATHPSINIIHDRWMFMICIFCGNVYYDPNQQFLYRIHQHNAIGVKPSYRGLQKLQNSLLYWIKKPSKKIYQDANIQFLELFKDELTKTQKDILNTVINYKENFRFSLSLIFDYRYYLFPSQRIKGFFSNLTQVIFKKI